MSETESDSEVEMSTQSGKITQWTDAEDIKIVQLHMAIGTKWTGYSRLLPGRPENAIKNRWNSTTRRVCRYEVQLKKQGISAIKADIENQVCSSIFYSFGNSNGSSFFNTAGPHFLHFSIFTVFSLFNSSFFTILICFFISFSSFIFIII